MAGIANPVQVNANHPNANMIEELRELLTCPVSFDPLTDPVLDPCGHTFQRDSIVAVLGVSATCPISGQPLLVQQLVPNRVVRDAAELLSRLEEGAPLEANAQLVDLAPRDQEVVAAARRSLQKNPFGRVVAECSQRSEDYLECVLDLPGQIIAYAQSKC